MTDIEAGEKAEVFVKGNINRIVSYQEYIYVLDLKEKYRQEYRKADLSEGENVDTIRVYYSDKEIWRDITLGRKEYKRYAERFQNCGGMDLLGFTKMRAEKIEVKADRNCRFLHLDKPNNPEGSLGFELWSNQTAERKNWRYGWLHGYYYPIEHTEENVCIAKKRYMSSGELTTPPAYVTPDVLVYVLENEKNGEVIPYATICFENVPQLLDYLNNKMFGILYPSWDIDPETINEDHRFDNLVFGNLLYVSLEELIKNIPAITVTLWGDIPDEATVRQKADSQYWEKNNKAELVKQRTEFLSEAMTDELQRINNIKAYDMDVYYGEQKLLHEFRTWVLPLIDG